MADWNSPYLGKPGVLLKCGAVPIRTHYVLVGGVVMGWRNFLNGGMGGSLVAVVVASILGYTELGFTRDRGNVRFLVE